MATSGPRYPQNAASVSRGGSTPGGSWSNPNNARTNDSSYAAVAIDGKSAPVSQYLHLTNFGFDIPAGATIDGIVVEIERQVNYQSGLSSVTADETVMLLDGGSPVGSNYAQPGNWATSWTVVAYGGETDTWGATWTPEKINATNFGVRIAVESTSSTGIVNNARIDFVRITVYYTQAGNVSGTVSDAETLAPLADVSVSSDDGKQTTTNASGEYTLTEVSSGTRTISFSLDGYEPTEENVSVTAGQTATLDVSLTPQRGIVAGIVRDAVTLQPIAGVSVTSDDGVSDTTAEDGSYELSPRVGSRTITLSHVAYHGAQETVTVSANDSVPLDITLDPKSYQATSDASGRYGFEVIRPGTYSVTIEAPDYEPAVDVVVIETDDVQVLNIDLERSAIPVGITRGLLWAIRAPLWIARTISHHVRSSLPADRQVRYHIRAGARTPREIAYGVQVPAGTTREIAYDISATAGTAREIAYGVQVPVITSRGVAYAVHGLLPTAREAIFGVRTAVATQRAVVFGQHTTVGTPREITFDMDAHMIHGRVRDVDTNEPLAGVTVILTWAGDD